MSYQMRFRVEIRAAVGDEQTVNDPILVDGGSYELTDDFTDDIVIRGVAAGVSKAMRVIGAIQQGFAKNAYALVFGQPQGSAETGATDLTAAQKLERLYASFDGPNYALTRAIAAANRGPSTSGAQNTDGDVIPEVLRPTN